MYYTLYVSSKESCIIFIKNKSTQYHPEERIQMMLECYIYNVLARTSIFWIRQRAYKLHQHFEPFI